MSEEKKIYVIVAKTVQNPVRFRQVPSKTRWLIVSGKETKTIVQPPGRIAAQVAHVVSKMRTINVKRFGTLPITTIILSVPDSFQLNFIDFLFKQKKINTYFFDDVNEEYGTEAAVTTAICTEPILPEQAEGVIDYLPLWDGK